MLPTEDLFVYVYVLIHDLIIAGLVAIPPRPGPAPGCSDAELLIIDMVRHLLAFDDRSWGDQALAELVPRPAPATADSNPMATISAARHGWPTSHELVGLGNMIPGASGQSGGDVVLVGESVEDLLPADPDVGEVDQFRRAGVSLTW